MNKIKNYPWWKRRGYTHLTAPIGNRFAKNSIIDKITSPEYVKTHAFFPLLFFKIYERKYKPKEKRKHKKKERPIHYANHLDSSIFSYYSHLLQEKYESLLGQFPEVSKSILAYRQILDHNGKGKGTIQFASEVFQNIKSFSNKNDGCSVLTFDIKSFFSSLDHCKLLESWLNIFNHQRLPRDHWNVFKHVTKFSYINTCDLKLNGHGKSMKKYFDEKDLARIRNNFGYRAFFQSAEAFRINLKQGRFRIHKNNKTFGIPQGLPISATLANIYLLDFDSEINKICQSLGAVYYRYSDDILIICKTSDCIYIEQLVCKSLLETSKVQINQEKTEIFDFMYMTGMNGIPEFKSFLRKENKSIERPLTYLGFEFYGYKTLIKSANLSKYYRKMIYSVKAKSRKAFSHVAKHPYRTPIIYKNQIIRSFAKDGKKIKSQLKKRLEYIPVFPDGYRPKVYFTKGNKKSSFIDYVNRASIEMNEKGIVLQIRNNIKILEQAIYINYFSKRKKHDN